MAAAVAAAVAAAAEAPVQKSGKGKKRAAEDPPPSDAWSCGSCTFFHEGEMCEFVCCEMCGETRPSLRLGEKELKKLGP